MTAPLRKTQPARKSQAERRSESEQALLKAAVDVIAAEGVGGVTFEALGRTGGFSRGLVSARFGTKANLIDAVLRHLHARQEREARELGLEAMPGLEAVLAYVDHSLRDMTARGEARAYFMLLSSSVAEASEMRPAFAATHAEVAARLAGWVARGQAEGAIAHALDPATTALMIGCMMFGMSMQAMVDPSVDLDSMRAAGLAMLRASLAVQRTS